MGNPEMLYEIPPRYTPEQLLDLFSEKGIKTNSYESDDSGTIITVEEGGNFGNDLAAHLAMLMHATGHINITSPLPNVHIVESTTISGAYAFFVGSKIPSGYKSAALLN